MNDSVLAPKLFVATKAFIEFNGKILVLCESTKYADGSNAGRFDVPGGRMELGQRFDESLRHEIKEETGLEVEIGSPFFVNEWRPVVRGDHWQIVGIFFKCKAQSETVLLGCDHDSFEWIVPAQYAKYNVIANLKPVFEAYLASSKT